MRSRWGTSLCLLALLQVLGGHWALLQAGAWVGMAVQYSRDSGVPAGLEQTFDGAHACPVCKAIQAGKRHEGKALPRLAAELKQEFVKTAETFLCRPRWVARTYPRFLLNYPTTAVLPAVPPPRRLG